jgi:hypothetical protein
MSKKTLTSARATPSPASSSETVEAVVSRYELHVLSPNLMDTVRYAGGLIFDKAIAGWHVLVLVSDYRDLRPIQILGADVADASDEQLLESLRHPAALLAPTSLEADERTWPLVGAALSDDRTEVGFWDVESPTSSNRLATVAQHQLSLAARALKAHALSAAGFTAESAESIEFFRCARARHQAATNLVATNCPSNQHTIGRSSL